MNLCDSVPPTGQPGCHYTGDGRALNDSDKALLKGKETTAAQEVTGERLLHRLADNATQRLRINRY